MLSHFTEHRLLTAAIATSLVAGCGQPSGSVDPLALLEGENIYTMECAKCHGRIPSVPPGSSGTAASPLRKEGIRGHQDKVIAIISHGVPGPGATASNPLMPGFSRQLTPKQIASVAAYLETALTQNK